MQNQLQRSNQLWQILLDATKTILAKLEQNFGEEHLIERLAQL